MAEIRNNFIKSKMNRDLDARLLPPGEYREAWNVSISRSEGDDVGALENVLGNLSLTDFGLSAQCTVDIIGKLMSPNSDRIFVFLTNYVDTSIDRLSNPAYGAGIECYIGVYDISANVATLLVGGTFLNFSKTHEIYGVNLINNLLFWTDNRNQPRKINIETALADPYIVGGSTGYYTEEDHISVPKYYPYKPIDLYKDITGTITSTMKDVTSEYLPPHCVTMLAEIAPGPGGLFFNFDTTFSTGPGNTIDVGDKLTIPSLGVETIINGFGGLPTTKDVSVVTGPGVQTAVGNIVYIQRPNPDYDVNWPGDKKFLNDKFVRFAYRFKFDDNEYSLISPFTQECFIPRQDGYFIADNEQRAYQSTEVKFMENKVDDIQLVIPIPDGITDFTDLETDLKVKEIDIVYKQSNESTLKVLDTLTTTDFGTTSTAFYLYDYQSRKPWRTLPQKDLIRVQDQAPVRALGQEIVANRVVYGNFIDKHTPPTTLNYNTQVSEKFTEAQGGYLRKEYPNHTLKQNRNYQVGVVLSDRYGRQSAVILSSVDTASTSSTAKGSTFFHPYKGEGSGTIDAFSYFPSLAPDKLFTPRTGFIPYSDTGNAATTWHGDSLKVLFNSTIQSPKSSTTGAPGLYNGDPTTLNYNPLGWYSYKIVVKQQQQEYYNIYFPGLLNGYIDGESKNPLAASVSEPIGHFALHSDNINKVPRDLTQVGPDQKFFRTGRPSPKEDPSYYQFVNTDGVLFTADPYTEEGELLLKTRDRQRDLDSGSIVTNASVKLYPRILNYQDIASTAVTKIYVSTAGTGYATTAGVATTGGTGSGLTVDITAGAGPVTAAVIDAAGTGYKVGDIVDISGGGTNAKVTVLEIQTAQNSQMYPKETEDVVDSIGTGTELGLWDPGVDSPYDTAPVFWGYRNNPYIAKLSLENWQLGVTGPSPYAGGQQFEITQITHPGNDYRIDSKNLAVEQKEDAGYGTGLLVDIDGIATTLTGDVDALSIAREGTGWIGSQAGVDYTDIKVTGGGLQDCTFDLRVTNVPWPGLMSPVFTVYENEPVESKLDIYWETTTAGLVSELNTAIVNSDPYTPYGTSSKTWSWFESDGSGTVITTDFFPTNGLGVNLTNTANSGVLNSVTDFFGNSYSTALFTLVKNPDGSFKIRTNSTFYAQMLFPILSFPWNFKINFTEGASGNSNFVTISDSAAVINNSEPVWDPTFVQGPNVTPAVPITSGDAISVSSVSGHGGASQIIATLVATNGSADLPSQYDGVTFTIDDTTNFIIDGSNILWVKGGTPAGDYPIVVTVQDLAGAFAVTNLTLTITVT
jgi:hypothetical protein